MIYFAAFILYYVFTATIGLVQTYYDYKEVENLHDERNTKVIQKHR